MKTEEREISGDTALASDAVVTQLLTSQVLRLRSLAYYRWSSAQGLTRLKSRYEVTVSPFKGSNREGLLPRSLRSLQD